MIVPPPRHLVRLPGSFALDRSTTVHIGPQAAGAVRLLRDYLRPHGVALAPSSEGAVVLAVNPALSHLGDEGYELRVDQHNVRLRAAAHAGLLHGVQSLRQLLPLPGAGPVEVPCVDVVDVPAFPWRGAMLDVARHFMPVEFLHRFVDLLALHKLNVLHLHLTDDQGWRMPVPGRPRLTEVGGWRAESMVGPAGSTRFDASPHGGAYTTAELRGLVAHAEERGVAIMPEIEMPGHARAALAAYPRLGNFPDRHLPVWTSWGVSEEVFGVQESTLDFCEEVLAEVMDVFPGERIHIGGDECPTAEWHRSPLALDRVAAEGLSGPDDLHSWFLARISRFLLANGRTPVCWDEGGGAPDLPAETAVMVWRDPAHGKQAARNGHPVIMTPWRSTYLDYPQANTADEPPGQPAGVVTLKDVYTQELPPPGWSDEESALVLGTQAQLWTEFVKDPTHAEYLAFPRLCALAGSAWSGGDDWPAFLTTLREHERRLSALSINHRPLGATG
ncbi:beta-N-acetylhexosaminidase [Umezawaea tangerina]|uniref:beta-N-acetylhexosaminidase n=1 Tax=Umezawaea tangerina TaxID=84725 RepID=A0A2T0SKA0_9PSEU|nr:beta-N-acetylhexosaminidase [Umezawaea tangerina]PRY33834.1 hexosaminidase [Umezawaea tangerina]